jgi:hypothetical protein
VGSISATASAISRWMPSIAVPSPPDTWDRQGNSAQIPTHAPFASDQATRYVYGGDHLWLVPDCRRWNSIYAIGLSVA